MILTFLEYYTDVNYSQFGGIPHWIGRTGGDVPCWDTWAKTVPASSR